MCFMPKQSEAGECQLGNLVNMVSKVKNGGGVLSIPVVSFHHTPNLKASFLKNHNKVTKSDGI